MNKPKILINVIPICPESKTIFIGKRVDDHKINVVSGKIKFGEEFDVCAVRLMKDDIGITINQKERLKFVCTYNVIDKDREIHYVGIMFYIILTPDEMKELNINRYIFTSSVFATIDDLNDYKNETFIALNIFMNKFNVKSIEDIKSIESN